MTRLAFRMDLLSNRVKGERFWSGFCSLLRFDIDDRASAVSTILASFVDSFPSSLLYERGIALIPPLSPRVEGTQGRSILEIFGRFYPVGKSDNGGGIDVPRKRKRWFYGTAAVRMP